MFQEDQLENICTNHASAVGRALKRTCAKHFPELQAQFGKETARRIIWFNVKARLESSEFFWNPLFELISGRAPQTSGRNPDDDAIWERIMPAGFKSLREFGAKIPSHAGGLPPRIPNLLPLPPRARIY